MNCFRFFSNANSLTANLSLFTLLLVWAMIPASLQAQANCPDPCACDDGIVQMQLYYSGEDNVTIEVFSNGGTRPTTPIDTLSGINAGQLITIDGSGMPAGKLSSNIFLQVTNSAGQICVQRIYSDCPNAPFPGAERILDVLGETYGDFTVYSRTDSGNNIFCSLSTFDENWRTGGNVVDSGNNTIGTLNDVDLGIIVNGREMITVTEDQVEVTEKLIVKGADLAERFVVNSTTEELGMLVPGAVLSIDRVNAGELTLSRSSYDRAVAGIVSGAGGVEPGMVLGQPGTIADGDVTVALTGRVYALVDAAYGAIEPGDLLTTSPTTGHAMKVTDYTAAQGAIIGKAMSGLEDGKGHVLVLISLQ